MDSEHRPPRRTRRILVKALQIIAGTVSGIVLYFFCERMFAGYPQYGTGIITYVGLAVIMATGGYAWIMDHRRLDADEPDADE